MGVNPLVLKKIETQRTSMKKLIPILSILSILLVPVPVYAHAFGQRYDLPIPLSYFMAGAAATVALSFVVIGIFLRGGSAQFRYPRFNLLSLPGATLTSQIKVLAAQVISALLLLLVLATSLFGSDNPLANFSPTFVWIIWWVGMGYIAALFGNLWMLINPWKALYEWTEWLLKSLGAKFPFALSLSNGMSAGLRPYPAGWDAMPALIAFLAFVWLENVYPGSIIPRYLGIIIIAYSVYTFGGMLLYGKHVWLRYGDPFAVLFGIFARFSPTEVRVLGGSCEQCELDCDTDSEADDSCVDCYACYERAVVSRQQMNSFPLDGGRSGWGCASITAQFNIRPWAAGLVSVGRVSWQTCAFVVLALAAVTFDGLQETTNWLAVQTVGLRLLGPGGVSVVDTLGVVLIPLLFLGIYLLFCLGIRALSSEQASLSEVARAYVFSLVPIALAYNMAHFLSLLLVQGQLIIPLAADPFGFGWDVFGGAGYRIDPTVISTRFAWIVSVGAIVVGHIISVYVAHTIAIRRAPSHALALRGQYPMLALMVFYTAVSLWIIAQPIVAQ